MSDWDGNEKCLQITQIYGSLQLHGVPHGYLTPFCCVTTKIELNSWLSDIKLRDCTAAVHINFLEILCVLHQVRFAWKQVKVEMGSFS